MTKNTKISLAIATILSIAATTGCSGQKPNEALESARATYERVSDKTLQDAFSTEDLNVAKHRLDSANKALNDKKDEKTINHRAYLAEQYALIAEQRSELLRYEAKIENGNMERTKVEVEMRASEAQTAQHKAESLQEEVNDRESQLAQQSKELEELKALQAKNSDRGMVLTLGDVLFDSGESSLKSGARYNIDRVAGFLNKYPDHRLVIEGHTDDVGDDESNYELSVERAFAVRSALTARGVEFSRIHAKGFGEAMPVASNADASGRQQNRRVDLIFDQPQSTFSETIVSEIDE